MIQLRKGIAGVQCNKTSENKLTHFFVIDSTCCAEKKNRFDRNRITDIRKLQLHTIMQLHTHTQQPAEIFLTNKQNHLSKNDRPAALSLPKLSEKKKMKKKFTNNFVQRRNHGLKMCIDAKSMNTSFSSHPISSNVFPLNRKIIYFLIISAGSIHCS